MENRFYCPICGSELTTEFSIGTICLCCGNECGYDDDIQKEDIDEQYYYKILALCKKLEEDGDEIPQTIKEYLANTRYDKKTAWGILREKWIRSGYVWKYKKPENWNLNKAREQLRNIGILS